MTTTQLHVEDTVSTGMAARMLGCSPEWVRDLIRNGKLPSYRVGAWNVIPRAAVEAMIAEKSRAQGGEADGAAR